MDASLLITSLFVLPLVAVLACIWRSGCADIMGGTHLTLQTAILVTLLINYNGPITVAVSNWPLAIVLHFDMLSLLFLSIISVMTAVIFFYSFSDKILENHRCHYVIGQSLLILGIIGAVSTRDCFNLYVWSEVILLSSCILLTCSKNINKHVLFHYSLFSIIATLLMLLSIALLYASFGTLDYEQLAAAIQISTNPYKITYMALFLCALAIKSGLFPFYFWLPKAYPTPAATVSCLLSALITKAMLVVFLRFWLFFPVDAGGTFTTLLLVIAGATMFFGVMGATCQTTVRGILSFHIVSQLGYILLGFALATKAAIVAGLYFMIHNIVVKTQLLMVAGTIENMNDTGYIKYLGHWRKLSPILALLFFISAMSLAGFPPFSGFWGKYALIQASIMEQQFIAAFVAIIVGLFTLYSMQKIWRLVFCEPCIKSQLQDKLRLPNTMFIPILLLTLAMLVMGLAPDVVFKPLMQVANELQPLLEATS